MTYNELSREQKIKLVDCALFAWASGDHHSFTAMVRHHGWMEDFRHFVVWLADNMADTVIDGIDASYEEFKMLESQVT